MSKHVGAEHKHGGDMRSSIINKVKLLVPVPVSPVIVDPDDRTSGEQVAKMIF
jgi:hypothetical protein